LFLEVKRKKGNKIITGNKKSEKNKIMIDIREKILHPLSPPFSKEKLFWPKKTC